ncbi:hypothetical protein LUZ60_009474 [Juncus effusus]|nr:hypothetical protein LUZ60_009474 [Juncus effusus]
MERQGRTRRPYTISKQRESWSDQEHARFVQAIHLFHRDWKKIGAYVGTKTVLQIRSHAQKYFQKIEKNSTGEYVPPPRPKRKLTNPFPMNFPNNDIVYAGSAPETWRGNHAAVYNGKPDFENIYGFLGDLFDPRTGHNLKKLQELDPIDIETVQLLMRNLYSNLTSTDFEGLCGAEKDLELSFDTLDLV